jgi:hypothetical protein
MMLSETVYGEYKGFLIVETCYQWGHEVVAIPDNHETLRRRFINYSRKERAQAMRYLIDETMQGLSI